MIVVIKNSIFLLRIWETICIFAAKLTIMEEVLFELELMEEARDFLNSKGRRDKKNVFPE